MLTQEDSDILPKDDLSSSTTRVVQPPPLGGGETEEVIDYPAGGDIVLSPEQALVALTEEQRRNLEYIAQLEASNSSLKATVNQLENQLATGRVMSQGVYQGSFFFQLYPWTNVWRRHSELSGPPMFSLNSNRSRCLKIRASLDVTSESIFPLKVKVSPHYHEFLQISFRS